jgi:hypothetical protein
MTRGGSRRVARQPALPGKRAATGIGRQADRLLTPDFDVGGSPLFFALPPLCAHCGQTCALCTDALAPVPPALLPARDSVLPPRLCSLHLACYLLPFCLHLPHYLSLLLPLFSQVLDSSHSSYSSSIRSGPYLFYLRCTTPVLFRTAAHGTLHILLTVVAAQRGFRIRAGYAKRRFVHDRRWRYGVYRSCALSWLYALSLPRRTGSRCAVCCAILWGGGVTRRTAVPFSKRAFQRSM